MTTLEPKGPRRQYASLDELEQACGDTADYIEKRLNDMRGRVLYLNPVNAARVANTATEES